MALSMTLGGHALPLPISYDPQTTLIVAADRMANGSMVADLIAEKHKIVVDWAGLSRTERDNLRAIYDAHLTQTLPLVLPDGRSYTVLLANAVWQEPMPFWEVRLGNLDPTPFFSVTLSFDEV